MLGKEFDILISQSSDQKNTYSQILKSTSIIGGSSVIVILFKIIQTKIMAIFLGPSGVGLIGIYGSVTGLLGQVTGMGIGSSGVRQIAESKGSNDELKFHRTVITLRRTAIILGSIGSILMLLFREFISQETFGNTDYSNAFGFLSVTLFFAVISSGQIALIQGLRRIGDLARLNILGALFGTLLSIPIVYFLGEPGIIFYLIAVSALSFMNSWWYARRIRISKIRISLWEITLEAKAMIRLGMAFMVIGLMGLGTNYFIRVIVLNKLGIDAAGFFQASAAIASISVGFILNSMGADFYPRLTTVANNNAICIQMVNEQIEVGILLSLPIIIATVTFAPYIIQILYSEKFIPAANILRWEILGSFLRVSSWPLGVVLFAKGKWKIFICTELLSSIVYVSLVLFLVPYFGLPGTGMAAFGFCLFYLNIIYFVIKKLYGFSLSAKIRSIAGVAVPSIIVVCLLICFLPSISGTAVGAVMTLAVSAYCLIKIKFTIGSIEIAKILSLMKSKIG
jgi:enterobacterial common antigen flippase